MTYRVDAATPCSGCCGHLEICDFRDDNIDNTWDNFSNVYSDEECMFGETFNELFENIKTYNKGYVYSIWFVKTRKYDGVYEKQYGWNKLRTLVRAIPNVIHLGSTINPNTGNKIDGYSWINK